MDKKTNVCDVRSDHQGNMLHMYSILAGKSRTPEKSLSRTGVDLVRGIHIILVYTYMCVHRSYGKSCTTTHRPETTEHLVFFRSLTK